MDQSLPSAAELRDEMRQELAKQRARIEQLEAVLTIIANGHGCPSALAADALVSNPT